MVTVDVLDPRHDPEPPYWGEFRTTAGLPACWDYALLGIAAWSSRFPLLLAVTREGGRPVGVVSANWVGFPGRRWSFVSAVRRPWAGFLHVRIPGSASSPGWWVDPARSSPEAQEVLRGSVRAMRRDLGRLCVGVLWRQVRDTDLAILPGRPKVVRETWPVALLPTGWRDVDEWIGSLGSERRKSLRRRGRQFDADTTLRFSMGARQPLDVGQVISLQRQHERKYVDRRWGRLPMPGSYFAGLLSNPDVVTLAYHDDTDRLLSFNVLLDHPQWPVATYYAGLPPEEGGRRHLYFDQYRHLMRWAIASGKEGVYWGKGNADLKSDFGAELVRQYMVASPAVTW